MSPAAQVPAPTHDAQVPAYLAALGIPALADIHIHFHPERLTHKIWDFFDRLAVEGYGVPWPIHYRSDDDARLATLQELGVRAVPSLTYAHKPGMADSLNDWCADFAARHPQVLRSATLYPDPGIAEQLRQAVAQDLRVVKMHVQVSEVSPDDPRLDEAWSVLEEAAVPVVLHAGSAPREGLHTGAAGVARLLQAHPQLTLVIAHLGMNEYDDFGDLVQAYPRVHLDTTMAGTDFMNQIAPVPESFVERLAQMGDRVVLGSDFPNIPYPYMHQIQALHRWGLGDEWMRKVLWHNGARLLRLQPDGRP